MRGTDYGLCFYYFFIKGVINIIDDMQVFTAVVKQRKLVQGLKILHLENRKDEDFKKKFESANAILERMQQSYEKYINA